MSNDTSRDLETIIGKPFLNGVSLFASFFVAKGYDLLVHNHNLMDRFYDSYNSFEQYRPFLEHNLSPLIPMTLSYFAVSKVLSLLVKDKKED